MTIQEAVNAAVAGGYHIHGSDGIATVYTGANREYSAWTRTDNHSSFMVPVQETFLDPAFWRALGRALGWEETCELAIICVHGHEECCHCHGSYWMYQWQVAYPRAADNVSRPLLFRLCRVNQPVIRSRNVFLAPRELLPACW
jgi:hypothetical protein